MMVGGIAASAIDEAYTDDKSTKEKAKLTEAYNQLSVPDKVLLVQKKMAEVDCKDGHGTVGPMFPAPTRPEDVEKALATDGCKLAAL